MQRIARLVLGASLLLAASVTPAAARTPGPTLVPTFVETAVAFNAATGEFDSLLAAVVRADLVATLNGTRQFTLFAPTDAAFADLFDALGVDGVNDIRVDTLRAVLLHHLAPGQRFSDDVLAASRIRTVGKGFLKPSIVGGALYVDDARIVIPDVDASNGVIHVIDRVLLP